MANKIEKGMAGQREAEKYLTDKGFTVLERNYRLRSGEIDLIAKDNDYTVFIEVKYRSGLSYGYPCESVTLLKQNKIKKTALHYITTHSPDLCDYRFDVVEVLFNNGSNEITHIENAFS
jgi:putative endonuclease